MDTRRAGGRTPGPFDVRAEFAVRQAFKRLRFPEIAR
jgi:hypothetical protein